MPKVSPSFPHDVFTFLHKPLRDLDRKEGRDFLARFLTGPQTIFEDTQAKIQELKTLNNPAEIRADLLQYLKDHVGFTKELNNITNDLSEDDLRKLIALAIPLWKQKGLEVGYRNIIRLFTGKGCRVFNWFDFRWIIGEKALGSEQLGEDAWLISIPGVEAKNPPGTVALLLSLENNVRDGSINQNHAQDHANLNFFRNGAVSGSNWYANFDGGTTVLQGSSVTIPGDIVVVPYHSSYNLDGNFTLEMFVRSQHAHTGVLFSQKNGTKEVSITFNSNAGTLTYVLTDGVTTVTETLPVSGGLVGNVWKHVCLIVNRTEGKARLYYDGEQATTGASLGALGGLTMSDTPIFVGGSSYNANLYHGDMDNLRLSLSDQYNLTNATIPVPGANFTGYIKEQLDEYKTDIRVVDAEGTLNKALIKRILNLMRPASERLNVIYLDFFEDFDFGKGDLDTIAAGSSVDDGNLILPAGAIEHCNATGNADYQDMVLQIRSRFDSVGQFITRFLIQDANNFYRFGIDLNTREAFLEKVVSGVPSALASPKTIPVFVDTFYIWTVITDFNAATGVMLIKCYQDSNLLFEIEDTTFQEGTWGLEAAGGQSSLSDIEMFLMPLELETINPGFNL